MILFFYSNLKNLNWSQALSSMNKIVYCLIVLLCAHSNCFSQVGIGTTNPDLSSVLDIESINKGILVPRLSNSQISTISDPATGLLVFNSDLNEFQFNCGNKLSPDWSKISHNMSVKYSNTSTTIDINTPTFTDVPVFGSQDWNDDSTLYNQSGNIITINATGRYRITANISYGVANAGNNSHTRVAVEMQLAINDIPTGTFGSTGYIRRSAGHNEASLHITEVFNITAGQNISVKTRREGNTATSTFSSAGTSNIYIERIK